MSRSAGRALSAAALAAVTVLSAVVPAAGASARAGGAVAGTVTRSTDGVALGYVDVAVSRMLDGAPVAYGTTGASGRYSFDGLAAGSYRLCFIGNTNIARHRAQGNPAGYVTVCRDDVQVVDGATTTLDQALDPGSALAVVAVDATTRAQISAQMSIYLADGSVRYVSSETMTAYGLEPRIEYRVCVRPNVRNEPTCFRQAQWFPETYVPSPKATPVTPAANEVRAVRVAAVRAGAIVGHVIGADREGLGGVQVDVFGPSGKAMAGPHTTMLNGNYTVPAVPESATGYAVCFSKAGYQSLCYRKAAWNGRPTQLPAGYTPVVVNDGMDATGISVRLALA